MAGNIGDAQVRFIIATGNIRSNRTAYQGWSDEEIVQRQGFQHLNDYWHVAMSIDVMTVPDFIDLLETHLVDHARYIAEGRGQAPLTSHIIEKSIREADEGGQDWFIRSGDPAKPIKLRPRAAADWLLSKPLHADHVPPTLRSFLKNDKADQPIAPKRSNKASEKQDAVTEFLLKKYPPNGLPPPAINKVKLLKDMKITVGDVSRKTLNRAITALKESTS